MNQKVKKTNPRIDHYPKVKSLVEQHRKGGNEASRLEAYRLLLLLKFYERYSRSAHPSAPLPSWLESTELQGNSVCDLSLEVEVIDIDKFAYEEVESMAQVKQESLWGTKIDIQGTNSCSNMLVNKCAKNVLQFYLASLKLSISMNVLLVVFYYRPY